MSYYLAMKCDTHLCQYVNNDGKIRSRYYLRIHEVAVS